MPEEIRPITMPKWGLAMTEGLVADWHVEVGDTIRRGQEAVDIETEKIINVFESPASGVVRRRVVEAGETVPVGALLAVLAEPSAPDEAVDAFVAEFEARFAAVLAARAEADDSGPEPQTVEVRGRPMRYLSMGEGDAPPLLLVHGFGGDLNNWLFNQPVLAEHRAVLAVDLPGHGGSAKVLEAPDVGGLAADVLAFIDAVALGAVHLAGHSLGGAIALELARRAPERARSLTLIASAGLGSDIDIEYIRGFIAAKRRKDLKPIAERLFADPALVRRELLDDLLKFKRIDGVPEILTRLADAVFDGGHQTLLLRDALGDLDLPRQVIWGAQDGIIPAGHADDLPASVAVHVLEGAGHMVHMEKAAEVNDLIGDLIDIE